MIAALMLATQSALSTAAVLDPYEAVMDCWVKQWKPRVQFFDRATEREITAHAALARKNCRREIAMRRVAIKDSLSQREKLSGMALETASDRQVKLEIDNIFGEYWSRD